MRSAEWPAESHACLNTALRFYSAEHNADALPKFYEAKGIEQNCGRVATEAKTILNIARPYGMMAYNKKYPRSAGVRIYVEVVNEMAGYHYNIKRLAMAVQRWLTLTDTLIARRDTVYLPSANYNLAGGCELQHNLDSTYSCLRRSFAAAQRLHNTPGMANAQIGFNDYYEQAETNREIGIRLAQEAIAMPGNCGHDPLKRICLSLLTISELELHAGRYGASHDYCRQMLDRQDSERQVHQKTLTVWQMAAVSSRKQLTASQAARDAGSKRLYFALAVLALLMGLLFLVYLGFRHQRAQNRQIKSLTGRLVTSLGEKETLLREIHHRVKNNLQVIISLLSLQLSSLSDPDARKAITESSSRVSVIALVHQQLYQNEGLITVNMHWFCRDLFDQVSKLY